MNNSTSLSYTVCNHDWSFLEGDKKHSRTLKEGRHVFPFQLRIGGSLPSSITTLESGGASVSYRLRAQATRPGLNHNLQAIVPVHIIRSLSQEALEYQQTLEIENTWPEKLMYSIMLPHKAWAAGDTLVALVKFSPLSKGTSIIRVASSLHETTSIYGRSGSQDHVRMVANVKQAIVNGRAVIPDGEPAAVSQPGRSGPTSSLDGPIEVDGTLHDNNDVVTTLTMPLPSTITPTHSVEPIVTSHRVRWSIVIANPDGHTSELRCSLPVHILDSRLLQEAKRHTAGTRRLLGGPEISISEDDDDMELPSYSLHVRDRVAGVALQDISSVGFSNNSTASGSGTPLTPDANVVLSCGIRSGHSTPLEPNEFSQLPHIPASGDNTSLEWITSELLSSQRQQPHQQRRGTQCRTSYYVPNEHTDSDASPLASRAPSRPTSRRSSLAVSRSASPEFHGTSGVSSSDPRHGFAVFDSNGSSSTSHPRDGSGTRNLHDLLKATMKPFTSIMTRSSASHGNLVPQSLPFPPSPVDPTSNRQSSQHQQSLRIPSQPSSTVSSPSLANLAFVIPRVLTEVPDYDAASRGFMGGLPPLTSLQDLPSYEAAMSAPSTPLVNSSAQSEPGEPLIGGAQLEGRLMHAHRARSESDLMSRMTLGPLENVRRS
jgi:hypothetical protein